MWLGKPITICEEESCITNTLVSAFSSYGTALLMLQIMLQYY